LQLIREKQTQNFDKLLIHNNLTCGCTLSSMTVPKNHITLNHKNIRNGF
jgi:hypothetical protein